MRERLVKGAFAQIYGHAVVVIVQVGGVSLLATTWGLHLYGEWLILTAIPTYLSFSDIGLFAAATNEMVMAVGREDRDAALTVFQAVSGAVLVLFGVLAVALPVIATTVPLPSLLNLSLIHGSAAGWIVVMLGLDTLLTAYGGILFGGFACVGHYGEGSAALASMYLLEFGGLAGVVLAGGSPALAATAILAARALGTVTMYLAMRRYAPWLRFGRAAGGRRVLRRLISPALASAAFPLGLALNVQGMVILVGVTLGPASAAIFSTLRTMSRSVSQLLASVFALASVEVSKAFAQRDFDLLRAIHRRASQTAVWLAGSIILILAAFGGPILHLWTSGKVTPHGPLLYLFLAVAGIDAVWYTSLAVLFGANRHQRVAAYYIAVSACALPLAYGLLMAAGLSGAALSLLTLELIMLVTVLRLALPAAHDSLLGWAKAIAKPPVFLAVMAGEQLRLRIGRKPVV